ncbi:type VI secretion system lipoprotein TssJ [Delftia sp. PS-11]|uniref:type VI secretion system lipoprotein TssJ n=1 Tax=Delftia sp. PS-11 TaxID=2767222 RepID=UPI002455C2CF|nr:type VI secretion system lipoprotein TssJ [Delftia sp. PS-11]
MWIQQERRQALRTLGAAGMVTAMAGCGTIPSLGRAPEPAPTAVPSALFEVIANADVNPDREGIPKPVLLRIYELRAAAAFERAGFFDLLDKDDGQLGSDFVRREEFLLAPGQRQTIENKGNPDVRTFGLFAAYRDLERSTWRAWVDAPNSIELRRRWWGLGATERLQPIRYVVHLTRDAVTVRLQPAAK